MNKNIKMFKGDTLSFAVHIMDANKQPINVSEAYFTCKKAKEDKVATFQKTLTNGITKVDEGIYRVRVQPSDTADIEAGKYFYDMQIGANDDVYTIMNGILEVEQDVTN